MKKDTKEETPSTAGPALPLPLVVLLPVQPLPPPLLLLPHDTITSRWEERKQAWALTRTGLGNNANRPGQ
jgi:hypothetical protein